MIKLKNLLFEKIVLDIKVGDTILVGKFKNKKMKVKSIGKDKHGMPTINGRKAATFRMTPKSNLKFEMNERVDFHEMATQIVKKAGLKSKIVFKNTGSNKADYNVDNDTINIKPTSKLKDFLSPILPETLFTKLPVSAIDADGNKLNVVSDPLNVSAASVGT